MTVKELINALEQLDQDAAIEIADSYTRSEGYDIKDIENASSAIDHVRFHNGYYIIEDDESCL